MKAFGNLVVKMNGYELDEEPSGSRPAPISLRGALGGWRWRWHVYSAVA